MRPGRLEVGRVGLMARLVFTSPFLSPAVGISRMGMGAHWSSCPVGDSTSVNPSSHMQMPACRGQHRIMLQVVLGHDSSGEWMEESLDGGVVCSTPAGPH